MYKRLAVKIHIHIKNALSMGIVDNQEIVPILDWKRHPAMFQEMKAKMLQNPDHSPSFQLKEGRVWLEEVADVLEKGEKRSPVSGKPLILDFQGFNPRQMINLR